MLKLLRKKIQSLTDTQVTILTVILIFINLSIVIFWIYFWVNLSKTTSLIEKPPLVEEIPEKLRSGEIGEISEEEIEEREILPLRQIVFNTSGIILEVRKDSLIVQGSGTNFTDREPRELTLIFTESTLTLRIGGGIKYQGLEGLKYLKSGMQILIEGNENIRGKTEFEARYIHILQLLK